MADCARLRDLSEDLRQAEFAWRDEISRLRQSGVRRSEIEEAAGVPRGTVRGMFG